MDYRYNPSRRRQAGNIARMLDRTIAPAADSAREAASLARRRALYAALTAATMVGLMLLAVVAVPPRGVGRRAFSRAVHADAAVVGGRILERDDWIPALDMRSRSGRRGQSDGRAHPRRRDDHRADRDPHVHPERGPGPGDPQFAAAVGWPRQRARSSFVSCLSAERQQRSRDRRRRGGLLRRVRRRVRRRGCDHVPAPRDQHGLQGRQYPRLLRPMGRRPRIRDHLGRRQFHAGRTGAAPGAHHAGQSDARHPADARHRAALAERFRAPVPVRHAAGHAFLHIWAPPGGRAIADPTGATTPFCASSPSLRIAACRCCRGAARSTVIS